jgi:transcriptional regulator with XRE-family HTH domain
MHHVRIVGKKVAMKRVSPVDEHVGARLRMRRLMLDMTQTDIAKALGLTFQQVQKYEKGGNRVSASRLQHLCKILDVPVSFFFDGAPRTDGFPVPAETDREAAVLNGFVATSDGLALVTAYTRIAIEECDGRLSPWSSRLLPIRIARCTKRRSNCTFWISTRTRRARQRPSDYAASPPYRLGRPGQGCSRRGRFTARTIRRADDTLAMVFAVAGLPPVISSSSI